MFITNTTVLGGRGFSIGGGVLKTASGYPLTLEKTLEKLPQSIAVSGASGGVGDKTANLFDPENVSAISNRGRITDRSARKITYTTVVNAYGVSLFDGTLSPNTTYTIKVSYTFTGEQTTFGLRVCVNGTWGSFNNTIRTFKTDSTGIIQIWYYVGNKYPTAGDVLTLTDIMLVEGSYTSSPMPEFDMPGYKIPILLSDGTTNKTINLYSDRQLTAVVYRLSVYPKTKEANLFNLDLSGLQDWTQDWKIPKADELIVSADTEVEPSSMEIKYYGKR